MIRKNFIMNPSFETNSLFWGLGGGATKAQSAAQFNFGSNSLLLTATTSGDSTYATLADAGNLTIGQIYIFSLYLFGSGTVTVWNFDGSADNFSNPITLTSTWTRYSVTLTANAATGVLAGVRLTSSNSVSCNIDGVMLEVGTTLRDYFDGSQANCSWNGTAHNSYSIQNGTATSPYRYGSVGDGMGRSESWT